MQAGRLRDRVRLEVLTEGRDAVGGLTEVWALVATLWAEVRDLRAEERYQAAQLESRATTRVRVRRYPSLSPNVKHRLVWVRPDPWPDRIYDIQGVIDPDGRKTELHIMCEEIVP